MLPPVDPVPPDPSAAEFPSEKEATPVSTTYVNPESTDSQKAAEAMAKQVQDAETVLKEDAQRKKDEADREKRIEEARKILATHRKAVEASDPQLATANKEVMGHAQFAAAAAILPPGLDVATVAGVQLKMLSDLAAVFNTPFSEDRGKAIIGAFAGSAVSTNLLSAPVAGVVKMIPGIGMLAGALGFGSVAFGSTYALGKLFTAHFASGGTLLNFDISKLRELGRSAA
jgi:uncharacterized protein (DUF697 family)